MQQVAVAGDSDAASADSEMELKTAEPISNQSVTGVRAAEAEKGSGGCRQPLPLITLVGLVMVIVAAALVATLVGSGNSRDPVGLTGAPLDDEDNVRDGGERGFQLQGLAADGEVVDAAALMRTVAPPLQLLAFTPTDEELLRDRQAITLVFSRAVTALGAGFDSSSSPPAAVTCDHHQGMDVDEQHAAAAATLTRFGSWRWVTSSIARFDPTGEWPAELWCDVRVNQSLRAWDGAPLQLRDARPSDQTIPIVPIMRGYRTDPLSMRVAAVESEAANQAAAGAWSPFLHDAKIPECPPDAQLTLRFSSPVNVRAFSNVVQVHERGRRSERKHFVINGTCNFPHVSDIAPHSACIRGYISSGGITRGVKDAELVIPVGAKVVSNGGSLKEARRVRVNGLLPFRFTFVSDDWQRAAVNSRNLRLHLSHGLASDVASLHTVISITDGRGGALSFSAERAHASELLLRVPELRPSMRFTVAVAASEAVRDAFDQPLTPSSETFECSSVEAEMFDILAPSNVPVAPVMLLQSPLLEGPFSPRWPLFGRQSSSTAQPLGRCNTEPSVWFDAAATGAVREIALAFGPGLPRDFAPAPTPHRQLYSLPESESTVPSLSIDTTVFSLLNRSATKLILRELDGRGCGRSSGTRALVMASTVALTIVVKPGRLIVFASNVYTVEPVAHVNIQAITAAQYNNRGGEVLGAATTRTDGLTEIQLRGGNKFHAIAVVATAPDGSVSIVQDVYLAQARAALTTVTATTDRGIYNILDEVHVTGVVRLGGSPGDAPHPPPVGGEVTLVARWSANTAETFTALTTRFGTFHVTLRVPAAADFGVMYLQLSYASSFSSVSFVIADPRLPSAFLDLPTPPEAASGVVLRTTQAITVRVDAMTFTRQPLGGANVSIKLHAGPLPQQEFHAVTGSGHNNVEGSVTVRIPLRLSGATSEAPQPSKLTVTATMLSPTRELVTQTLQFPIATALVTPAITLSDSQRQQQRRGRRVIPSIPTAVTVTLDAEPEAKANASRLLASRLTLPTERRVSIALFATNEQHFTNARIGPAESTQACTLSPSDPAIAMYKGECEVTLPRVGVFIVEVSIRDVEGNIASSSITLGESADAWNALPLHELYPITARLASPPLHGRGHPLVAHFENPYRVAAKALYTCATAPLSPLHAVEVNPGATAVPLQGISCDCMSVTVSILLPVAAAPSRAALEEALPVPLSPAVDFAAPHVFDWTLQPQCSRGLPPSIVVRVNTSATVVGPGDTVEIDMETTDEQGLPVDAEVTLTIVEKSILDLHAPAPLHTDPSLGSGPIFGGSDWRKYELRDRILTPRFLASVWSSVSIISEEDPWLPSYALSQKRAIFGNATLFGRSSRFSLTPFPMSWNLGAEGDAVIMGGPMEMLRTGAGGGGDAPMAADDLAKSASTASAPTDGSASATAASASTGLGLRSSFPPTAAVIVMTTDAASGRGRVRAKLSDNVGTWVVHAIAVRSAGARPIAQSTLEIVARKDLQVVASVPRVVRVGDEFHAGVVASAVAAIAPLQARVTLVQGCKGLAAVPAPSATITLQAARPQEALFAFRAVAHDPHCELAFTIAALNGSVSDGVRVHIPVLSPTPAVDVGTSFALRDSTRWDEGLALPLALPGGEVGVTISVGRLAAIEAAAQALLRRHDARREEMLAYDALEVLSVFAAMSLYHRNSETNQAVAGDQGSNTSYPRISDAAAAALTTLQKLTTNANGLRYSRGASLTIVDLYLNLHAIHVFTNVLAVGQPTSDAARWLVSTWTTAVAQGLQQHEALVADRSSGRNLASPALSAMLYHAFGPQRLPDEVRRGSWMGRTIMQWDVLVRRVLEDRDPLPLHTRARVLVTATREGIDASAQRLVLLQLVDQARVQGRTAYVAASRGSPNAPPLVVSALLLEAMVGSTHRVPNSLMEKFCNFVALGAESGTLSLLAVGSAGAEGERALAIAAYDRSMSSTNPQLQVSVFSRAVPLAAVTFAEDTRAADRVKALHFPLDTFRHMNASANSTIESEWTLHFESSGVGEASVALAMHFFPQLLKPNVNRFFGLFVDRRITVLSGRYAGRLLEGSATPLSPGDVVQVTIAVTTADDVGAITITALSAGGLEAIDSNLEAHADLIRDAQRSGDAPQRELGTDDSVSVMPERGAAALNRRRLRRQQRSLSTGRSPYMPWWGWFFRFNIEMLRDRVRCSGFSPSAGTYECTYIASATTSGRFVVPPIVAEVNSQPEVSGMSKFDELVVLPRS